MDTKYGIHCRGILGCHIMNAVGIPWCLRSCWKSGRLAVAQQWHRCGGNWYTITSWDQTLGLHWAKIWPIREPYLAFRQEVRISNRYLFVVTIHTSDMQYVSLACQPIVIDKWSQANMIYPRFHSWWGTLCTVMLLHSGKAHKYVDYSIMTTRRQYILVHKRTSLVKSWASSSRVGHNCQSQTVHDITWIQYYNHSQ